MGAFAVGSILAIAHGYDALPSIFESVSAASNAGLSAGIVSPSMPIGLEIFYMVEMWLGRLEFVALFAMFVQIAFSLAPQTKRKKDKETRDVLEKGGYGRKGGRK